MIIFSSSSLPQEGHRAAGGGLLSVVNITIFLVIGGLWWKALGLW